MTSSSVRVGMFPPSGPAELGQEAARACLAPAMEAFYQLPFERFERYCPAGTPEDVAEFLAPYAAAGCTEFNLIPQVPGDSDAIAVVAAVKRLLTPVSASQ